MTYAPHRSGRPADQPDFINLSFAQNPSFELFIHRVDVVIDPTDPQALISPPPDLAAWIANLPGLTVVSPPMAVTVGGVDAQQIDVLAGDSDLSFGPSDIERRHMARFIVVSVDGHEVLIKFLAQEESTAHFDSAVEVFQPLVDSMVWN